MEETCNCERKKERNEKEKRALRSRINRIIGQLNGIAGMIESDRYCDEVLIQLSAVDKAVKSLSNCILEEHMRSCLVRDIQAGELNAVEEILVLLRRFQ